MMKKILFLMIGLAPFFAAQAELTCVAKTTTDTDLYKVSVDHDVHSIASVGFGEDKQGQLDALDKCNELVKLISCAPAKEGFDLIQTTESASGPVIKVLNTFAPFYSNEELCQHAGARYVAGQLKKPSKGTSKVQSKADQTIRAMLSLNHPTCKS